MLLQDLLGINEEIYLVEESYLSLRTIETTLSYMESVRSFLQEQKLYILKVRDGTRTLGLLLFNPEDSEVPVDFWSLFTGIAARESSKKEFEALADLILSLNPPFREIEVPAGFFRDAVNEYYSLLLVNRNLCPGCTVRPESYNSVFSEQRVARVSEIFEFLRLKGFSLEGRMLEVCCGNGMSTLALYRLGLSPLSVEINKCMVCQGLEHGVLDPKKALVMDATKLSAFFDQGSFDAVFGFMLGLIYEFNKELWTGIMREAVAVAKDGAWLLFTVSSRPEIEILARALQEMGVMGEIVDNTDAEGSYDQWFFVGRKGELWA